MRVGEILLGYSKLKQPQLSRALTLQERRGGRIGTILIEEGIVSLDDISTALSAQHQVPAVLMKHLPKLDQKLLGILPSSLAAKFEAFPLASRASDQAIVCVMRSPDDPSAKAGLQEALGYTVVPAVMAEIGFYRYIARLYGLELPRRFHEHDGQGRRKRTSPGVVGGRAQSRSSRTKTQPGTLPAGAVVDGGGPPEMAFSLATLDDRSVSRDLSQYKSYSQQSSRTSALDWATPPPAPPAEPGVVDSREVEPASAATALETIKNSDDRDNVMGALLSFMVSHFDVTIVFLLKPDILLGQAAAGIDDNLARSLIVPQAGTKIFAPLWNKAAIPSPAQLTPETAVDKRICSSIGYHVGDKYVLLPIEVASKAVAAVFGRLRDGRDISQAALNDCQKLADASGEAFLRIIRMAKAK